MASMFGTFVVADGPRRIRPLMEFLVEPREYSVVEFYETFADCLPQLALVSQGFFGDISEDTFDRDMVTFIIS